MRILYTVDVCISDNIITVMMIILIRHFNNGIISYCGRMLYTVFGKPPRYFDDVCLSLSTYKFRNRELF